MREMFAYAAEDNGLTAALRVLLRQSDGILRSLHDLSYGAIGMEVLKKFENADCLEAIADNEQRALAAFMPFEGPNLPSYTNLITYHTHVHDDNALRTIPRAVESFCGSRHHEINHALAWNNAPALHASPFNGATRVIMSPLDWINATLRTEEDTYAKQGWLASLAARDYPGFFRATARDPISAETFIQLRQSNINLTDTLKAAAQIALDKDWGPHPVTKQTINFREYYQQMALSEYERMVDCLQRGGINPMIVRLEPAQFHEMSQTAGPNIYDESVPDVPLSPRDAARLASLNQRLGIHWQEDLPSFENLLESRGQTAQEFMEASKRPDVWPQFRQRSFQPQASACAIA